MSPKRPPSRAKRLATAIDTIHGAIDEIRELQDEIGNWKSGLEGTNLENSSKFTELEECYDFLEDVLYEIENACEGANDIVFPGMF